MWPPLLQSRLLRVKNTRFGPLMYNLNDLYIGHARHDAATGDAAATIDAVAVR